MKIKIEPSEEKIVLVNEHDEVIGSCLRSEKPHDAISRVSGLWIENSQGEVLLAQRAFTKKRSPGKWNIAVAGTVELGETYDTNILKESQEEIGYTLSLDNVIATKVFFNESSHKTFVKLFFIRDDIDIQNLVLEPGGVADVQWITRDEARRLVQENPEKYSPFIIEMLNWMDELRKDGMV